MTRERGSEALGRYEPGLDGVRAMAVIAVLVYHAEFPWAKGGFLGISLFFTLSGFLITSILLRTHDSSGRIGLRTFWGRRYRRLLPAAYLTLAGVVLFAATVATEQQLRDLPQQVVASILQVVNWFFVSSGQSYVGLFAAPSPVQHFWSLSIEEQFYVFMPLVLLVLLQTVRSRRTIGAAFAAGALASTALMFVLYERGASLDRLYYGTDTRVAELLVGCTLAVVLHARPPRPRRAARSVWALIGVAAFVAILWGWARLDLVDSGLYRGGFLVFALLAAALIVDVLVGAGPVPVLLASRPLAAIGRISYGVYLFHWPIFLWLDADRTGLSQWPLFGLRVAVTFALATASYYALEMPVRRRAFNLGPRRTWAIGVATVVAIVIAINVVSARDVETNLAGIDEAAGTAPIAATDSTLDILVIADAAGAPLAQALTDAAARSDGLSVKVASPFACTEVAGAAPTATCANWQDEWQRIVADFDPDVVAFAVSDWDAADIAWLSGGPDVTDQRAWTEGTLRAGFDLLTARGAPIVWTPGQFGLDDVAELTTNAFFGAMAQIVADRPDLRRHDFADDVAPVLADLRSYRRRAAGDVPRVMVVGDSSSRTLGYGLEHWAAETGAAVVWSAGTGGCGLADDGSVVVTGREAPVPELCRTVQPSFARQIAEFDPDLVIVMSTIYDLQQRRLDEWSDMRVPGDPGFDDYLAGEYVQVYDALSSGGAKVLWLNNPCAQRTVGPWPSDSRGGPLAPDRIAHVNDAIIGELSAQRPDVHVFDMYAVMCPDGKPMNRAGGVEPLRVDGIHFTPDGSLWFARTYGDQLLDEGLR